MIETFIIKNYRSYRDRTELSFVASNKEGGKKKDLPPVWYKEINGKRILRLLLCVGLNGTGKSKMFSALNYLRMIATAKPQKPSDKPEYRPFLLDNHSSTIPTELALTYYIEDVCFSYNIKISSECIEEEELKLVQSRSSRVFYRFHNKELDKVVINYGNACDLSKSDQHDLEVNTLANASVLSTFGALNLESQILTKNFDYFENHISMVHKSDKSLADKLQTGDVDKDRALKKLLLRLLNDVGTNICDYVIEEASLNISELKANGAPDIVINAMMEQYPSGTITHKNLRFIHSTIDGENGLDFELESLGTKNIIRLLVVLYDVILGEKSTCIDEIEYGIHTKALAFILKMYLTIAENCQLIVATHDLSLLNADFLRRDAVRLFEKDEHGSTNVRRRDYLHNTISFYKTYEKEVSPHIDELMRKIEMFLEYKNDINKE
ncbi:MULTISPECIES: AAA family ATPase [Bacteroidales]|uniref:AAA family ATPase n=1 Tax=Bacteroidales TaxID=171549 RepID=UPI001C38E6EB|nr:AAA family ATPase [Phocaeicola vulgatus]MBV3765649.1 ATP-binding protein [Phocaeicola vulgatus]MBV3769941.1 ATP-binding protein [Phocaeicola vulgatus]MBV3779251.1 ATP-binding protein [Phocaeicola vulgatus]MBV3788216.1 ATP-binding protein [Phocaeicola vulgatus]MBV3792441.1 ATP-binding protein [Phocaeicola vulgatus]